MKDCRDCTVITVQKCPGLFDVSPDTGLSSAREHWGSWRSSSPGQNLCQQRGHFIQNTSSDPKIHPEEPDHPGCPADPLQAPGERSLSHLSPVSSLCNHHQECQVFEGVCHLIVWKQRFNHKSCQALPELSFISQTQCPRVMYSSNGYWFKLWAFYKIRNYYLWFK